MTTQLMVKRESVHGLLQLWFLDLDDADAAPYAGVLSVNRPGSTLTLQEPGVATTTYSLFEHTSSTLCTHE